MAGDGITISFMSRSILHDHEFSWVFLVDWLMILFLSVFVLFYFNQLLGFVVTQTVCRYFRYKYGVYVKIQSIEISLMGGRIQFRNIVYIGTSQAVRIVRGNLNWRYWLSNRMRSAFVRNGPVESTKRSALQLKLHGVEWFVYNREYAYEILSKHEPATAELAREIENWQQGLSYMERKLAELLPLHIKAKHLGMVFGNDDTESLIIVSSPETEMIVDMAPASTKYDRYMACVTANIRQPEVEIRNNPDYQVSSIVPGQDYTKDSFSNKKRRRRWMHGFKAKSQKEPNGPWLGLKRYMETPDEYIDDMSRKQTQSSSDKKTKQNDDFKDPYNMRRRSSDSSHRDLHRNDSEQIRESEYESNNYYDFNDDSTATATERIDTQDEKQNDARRKWNSQYLSNFAALPVEYAKVSQIASCDNFQLDIRIDVVGKANFESESFSKISSENEVESDNLDSEKDPIFDIKMKASNAKINYGPFAERQRQSFFSIFFPTNCTTAVVPQFCSTGTPCMNGLRMHPQATVNIEFLDETTLVVPVREFSKDDEFSSMLVKSLQRSEGDMQRTYGWLEVRAGGGSSLNVQMPFTPEATGFHTKWKIELKEPDVRSSVNHDTMFCAENHRIEIIQHQPLLWNALQTYKIENISTGLDFYALREHVTLVSDTMTDFTSGPPVSYPLFVPARYITTWNVTNFRLYLNVNKGNIINKPTSLSENTFLIFRAADLSINIDVPRKLISSPTTKFETLISAPKVELELSAPNWHTLHGFLDCQRMARVENFRVLMDYHISTLMPSREGEKQMESNPSRYVDTQIIDISGEQFAITAHGFLIDYLMRIRENYFGHAYHFQTTEEFLQKHNMKNQEEQFEFSRTAIDTDTEMRIRVEKGCFLLPTRLYSCHDCISFQFAQLNANCRFTNYYMDLQTEITPLCGRLLRGLNPGTVHEEALRASFSNADLSITQIEIHAHRMFGLPPSEPTYVVRWDFDIGDITMDFPLEFAIAFCDCAPMVFKHSFADDENKPVLAPEELNDVTFLTLNVASVDATIRPPVNCRTGSRHKQLGPKIQFATSQIKLRMDDLANDRYSAHRTTEIPFIGMKAYTEDNQLAFEAHTALNMTTFVNKQHSREFYEKQQSHIALHDSLFHRSPFLLDTHHRSSPPYHRKSQDDDVHPCIPLANFDPPLTRENLGYLAPQFSTIDERWDNVDSSKNSSIASLANDSRRGETSDSDSSRDESLDEFLSVPQLAKSARAKSAKPSPDVFPFSSSTISPERERLRSKKANFGLHASQWHPDAPQLPVDDDVTNISAVIQILPINISFTPSLIGLIEAFEPEPVLDFEAQLDLLQAHIVHGLMRAERFEEAYRVHLITPVINVEFSERVKSNDGVRLEVKQVDGMLKIAGKTRGANVKFDSLSISLRHGSQNMTDLSKINAASVVLSKLSFWWQETSQEDGTGSLNLESVDASIGADNIDWAIKYLAQLANSVPSNVRRSSDYQSGPNKARDETSTRSLSKQDRMKATFYALTMAGEKMGVEQDSYVLSRPSGAVQSQAHVRTKTSWRLVMRLRYLLQRLPPQERSKMEKDLAEGKLKVPENAKDETLDVYRRWRSWEQSRDLADTEIFKLVFDDKTFQEYVLSLSTRFFVSIESMVARIVFPDMHDHFVGVDQLQMQLVSTQKNETQNLSLTFRCSKARARSSIELLTVAATILEACAALNKVPKYEEKSTVQRTETREHHDSSRQSEDSTHPSQSKQSNSQSSRALQASISVFLLDLSLEFDFISLKVETQNHQIQFTSAVELMESVLLESLFHTGTLVTSDGAFRIYQQSTIQSSPHGKDVLDSLVQGIHVGYASRGLGARANTWATVDVNTVSFITHPTALQLATIIVTFLEKDMPVIRKAVDELQKSASGKNNMEFSSPDYSNREVDEKLTARNSLSQYTDSETSSDIFFDAHSKINTKRSEARSDKASSTSSAPSAGHYMNINVTSVKVRARLVEDLRFVFQGKDFLVKLRRTDAIAASLDVSRCTVGIHFGDGSAAVANTQLESVRTVLRYDPELTALAAFNNALAIRLETMSLVWILEYVKHRKIDSKIAELLKKADKIFELISHSSAPAPDKLSAASDILTTDADSLSDSVDGSENQPMSPKLKLRFVNRVREISIRLPLDASSFKLTVANARLHFENFHTFTELETTSISPETMGAGIDDLKLELFTTRKPLRELIRLNFGVTAHKEEGKALFDVNSDYIRFALDPEAVGAIFIAIEKLTENSRDIFSSSEWAKQTPDLNRKHSTRVVPSDSESPKELKVCGSMKLENIRIKLLLQYLTVTWYTGSDSAEGVLLGFDKLQIRVAKLISHAELANAYVTPVSTTTTPMKDRLNTAFLPSVHVYAFVLRDKADKMPWVQGEINGKSIVLTVTPSVALWGLALVDSFTKTSETIERLVQLRRRNRQVQEEISPTSTPPPLEKKQSLDIPFNVRVNSHFDRGVLKLMEENPRSKEAALELFSPTLDVAMEFKRNQLLLRIDASQTSNQIFPKAIAEIKAMTTMIGLSLKDRAGRYNDGMLTPTRSLSNSQPPSPAMESKNPPSASPDSSSIFNTLEMDIRIHFDSQELYLSCLPYGKIGAMLATDGLDMLMTAPQGSAENPSYVTFYGLVKKTRISLQHMYSREISGMMEFSQLIMLSMHRLNDPYRVAINLNNPKLDIDLSKLHDVRIFFDIWALFENSVTASTQDTFESEPEMTLLRRKYSTASSNRPNFSVNLSDHGGVSDEDSILTEKPESDEHLIDKYRRAISTVPFAVLVNFTVSDLVIVLGMGAAIGEARISMNKCWFVFMHSINVHQMLNSGIENIVARFDGRLGGVIKLDGIMMKMAVQWTDPSSDPLVHLKFRIKKFGFYFSLDFHPFIAGDAIDLAMVLTTQDKLNATEDRIHVALTCESVSLALTALVVAHSFDVVSLFKRLKSHISSVSFIMPEAAQEKAIQDVEKRRRQRSLKESLKRNGDLSEMHVLFDVHFGELLIHAFPTEFVDNTALKMFANRFEVHFDRRNTNAGYETGLDLAADECVVGVANIKGGGYAKTLTDLDYEGFLVFVRKSSTLSSTIANTPEVTIVMDTWHDNDAPQTVYYTFSNEVHGSVEVGWNFGSINFIKEMMNAHRDAWDVRQNVYEATAQGSERGRKATTAQAYREATANLEREGSLISRKRASTIQSEGHSRTSSLSLSESKTDADDKDSQEVMVLMGVKYIAKKPPTILIPQLRDLGDATPPIEWLGVNRERIPLLLDYFFTNRLTQSAEELEKIYAEVLGKLD